MFDQKTYMQEYAQKHRERISAYKSAWKKKRLEDPEYRDRENKLAAIRRSKKDNKEQKIKSAIRTSLWKKANPGRTMANVAKRKTHIKLRTPRWLTEIDFERIQNEYKLAALLTKLTKISWEVDHVIPLKGRMVSGLHVPSNLRAIPAKQNRVKANKLEA
jgi:5-methylcytosine-specific restriction endonuclease McrA